MKKISQLVLIFILAISFGHAQDLKLKLWENEAPNNNTPLGTEKVKKDINGNRMVSNISEAELFVYLPEKEKQNGTAVIICPGGGYSFVAVDHEGYDYVKFLKENGIVGIVLKYRLPYGKHNVPVSDGLRAVRLVRSYAKEWHIDDKKIGIAGFSAGGHLASTIGTKYDIGKENSEDPINRISSRPDFMLLIYPVISFNEEFGYMGTRVNFFGNTHSWRKVSQYCNELNIKPDTPPTFLVHCNDDFIVSPLNSIAFYQALQKAKVKNELHVFTKGGHGFGMHKQNLPVDVWLDLSVRWINNNTNLKSK